MNWEGHDEWFHDNSMFGAFMEGVAPPIQKPLPACDTVRQRHQENVYEQLPLPGKNCVEAVAPPPAPA
jgi:hypothetical protein